MTTDKSRADALTNHPREVEECREALRGEGFVPVFPELQDRHATVSDPVIPAELHHDTAKLVRRFARALANKLLAAQRKYGYSDDWMRDDWADECRVELMRHVHKGDPRDVAAYCAFLWHHDESTAPAQGAAVLTDDQRADLLKLEAAATPMPWRYQENSGAYTHIVRSDANPGMIVAYGPQNSRGQVEADVRFIAAIRNAAPALLAASPVEQPAETPADLEGLRRAVLTPRAIVRDEDGMLSHPAVPYLDEDVNYETFFAAFGIEAAFVHMENDVDCDTYNQYFASNSANCSLWAPSAPAGDGWLLLEIYDTEDGPVALFVREKKPESMRERWKREAQERSAAASAPADERAAFEWPMLPLLPEAVITTAGGEAVFTAHQMQGYANAYGEMVRARAASASEPRVEEWMMVSDRLPPLGRDVLVAVEFFGPGDWRIKVGALNDQGQWCVFGGSWTPTHWMFMPPSPGIVTYRAPAQAAEPVALPQPVLDALRFYANGHHFDIDAEHQQFDTVSGEPANWLFSERDEDCTMIEDGSIARAALCGGLLGFEEPETPLEGEGFAAAPQPPAQADAREALTDEQRGALQACVDVMLHDGVPVDAEHPACVALDRAEALLADHPGQPEPNYLRDNGRSIESVCGLPEPRAEVTDEQPSLTNPLTPYGMLVRALRIVAQTSLYDMGQALLLSPAKLSAMEFGRESVTPEIVREVGTYFESLGIHNMRPALQFAVDAARAGDAS
ncbi:MULTISPECIES: DUF551 domain-containing protein [Burkholderia]|uniref:DUF551 domain-containing protein n=1 Tax=Burkholderia TaxID=32008 RepID=UPI00158C0DDF|nr:DUF551 domain-containing protein [Burkholderia ambifaria]